MEDREVKSSERKVGDLDKKQPRRQGRHFGREICLEIERDRATSFMIKRPLVGLSFLIKVSDLKLRIHDGKRVGRVVSRYKEKQSRDGLTSFRGGGGSVRRGK